MELKITIVGHPFNPIGTGRALRLSLAACQSVAIDANVRDVWNCQTPEADQLATIVPFLTDQYGPINLFHLNGNEIGPALERLGPLPRGHNIVFPFWELSNYPKDWARELSSFNEVWAASRFIQSAIASAVSAPVFHMPLPTQISLDGYLNRRYFNIAEDCYVFIFFFDYRSYASRKNPAAVVEAFRQMVALRPWARCQLVIKTHGSEIAEEAAKKLTQELESIRDRVIVIDQTMSEQEVHNLVRCCDAFVSLHRSEGYGLGLAEAMYLGLPVIGTGYSGNMDFMTRENSIPIGYHLIPLGRDDYPYASGQHWADPDIAEAVAGMIRLVDDPVAGRALGAEASRSMRSGFSYRAAGLRYVRRLNDIQASQTRV